MIKFFSNTILSYLEDDVNAFIKTKKCLVLSIQYNTLVVDGELLHNVLLYYTIPTE